MATRAQSSRFVDCSRLDRPGTELDFCAIKSCHFKLECIYHECNISTAK